MFVAGLEIPNLLTQLIDAGIWPSDEDALRRQNLQSLIQDRNRRLRRICLYPPPFKTVAESYDLNNHDNFYSKYGAIHELVPAASIPIADFGHGSDSPILLDYRSGSTNPLVINLEWSDKPYENYWAELATDFESFANLLGLKLPGLA
jgi:hypothetical protein